MRITARPVVDQLTPKRRTKYKGEGFCLGAQVIVSTEIGRFPAQIWAKAPTRSRFEWWWVVDGQGNAWDVPESDLRLVGQAQDSATLVA